MHYFHRLRFLLVAGCMAASLSSMAINAVVVTADDGEETVFALENLPAVTFSSDALIISSQHKTIEYPLTSKVTFSFQEVAAVEELQFSPATPVFLFDKDSFEARGLRAGSQVKVYDSNGILLARSSADAEGTASINLSSFSGILIINTESKTLKIRK